MTPEQLKGSILFAALQGKLVEQKKSEDTPDLSTIKCKKTEAIEFDIPNSWKIGHLESISTSVSSKQYQIAASEFKAEGKYPVISQSKEYIIGYCNDNTRLYHHDNPVIVFGDHTTIVKYVDFDFIVGADGVKIFNPNTSIVTAKFLGYVLEYYSTGLEKAGGYSRHYKFIKDKPIPIPPIKEQLRIVSKIEEILPYVDRYAKAYEKLEQFNAKFPEDMKKSILQYAIQGKLVEQRPEEGTAEELYQQIQEEKKKMIKENMIKKEKPLAEITEDEIPFEIPNGWKWVRLRSLGSFSSGKTPTMSENKYWENGNVPWITSKDMKKKYLSTSEMLITKAAASEMKIYTKGTMLMVVRSGILKRLLPIAILTEDSTINQDIKAFSLYIPEMVEYVYTVLKGLENRILHEYRKQVTTVDSLRFEEFQDMPIPLPPIAEQHRIVAKVEELLPYCNCLIK